MDQYKQSLCGAYFGDDCKDESDIFRYAVEDKHRRNLNVNGKLHSRYLEEFGCYEPAVIYEEEDAITYFWLFDDEIKDCLHPFAIKVDKGAGTICLIDYYSSKRIQQLQPIWLEYEDVDHCSLATYNEFIYGGKQIVIIDDPNIPNYTTCDIPAPHDILDITQFVTIAPNIICPLWSDEFASIGERFKFKFED